MKKQKHRQLQSRLSRWLVLHMACAGTLAIGLFATITCVLLPIVRANEAAVDEAKQNYHLHTKSQELEAIHSQLEETQNALLTKLKESFNQPCPQGTSMMQMMTELVDSHHLSLNAFSERTQAVELPQGTQNTRILDVRLTGDYAAICRWLAQLPRLELPTRVSVLTLVPHSSNSNECNLHAEVQVFPESLVPLSKNSVAVHDANSTQGSVR